MKHKKTLGESLQAWQKGVTETANRKGHKMKRDLKEPAQSKERKRDKDNPKQQYREARKAKGQRLAYERAESDKD